jgi:hypothetical protein
MLYETLPLPRKPNSIAVYRYNKRKYLRGQKTGWYIKKSLSKYVCRNTLLSIFLNHKFYLNSSLLNWNFCGSVQNNTETLNVQNKTVSWIVVFRKTKTLQVTSDVLRY